MPGKIRRGRLLRISGVTLCTMGLVTSFILRGVPGVPDNELTTVLGWLVIPLLLSGAFLFWRGRQYAAQAAAPGILAGSGPQILYLRPFRSDTSIVRYVLSSLLTAQAFGGFATEEEQLRDALQAFGELVAIGRPGEKLPTPGAARIYASDEEWKSVVAQHMASARLVIIRAGSGRGLLWEMREAIRTVEPSRLLILFLHMKRKHYEAFREQAAISLELLLPPAKEVSRVIVGVSGFLAFSNGWRPIYLRLRAPFLRRSSYKALVRLFRFTLRPIFEESGVPWRAPSVSALTISGLSVLALIAALLMVIAGISAREWWHSRLNGNEAPVVQETAAQTTAPSTAPEPVSGLPPQSPVEEAEARFQARIMETPALRAQMESIANSPAVSALPAEAAERRAEEIAREFSHQHARAGLLRLQDDALLTKLDLDRKLLAAADPATCAAYARGSITHDQFAALLGRLKPQDIDLWFDVMFQALKADVEGSPARAADQQRIQQSLDSMLAAMPAQDSVRLRRILANYNGASDAEVCWTERSIREQIALLNRSDQVLWALSMSQ